MEDECSHGVEWDIPCAECEMVSLDETILHAGEMLDRAKLRKTKVQTIIDCLHETLNEVLNEIVADPLSGPHSIDGKCVYCSGNIDGAGTHNYDDSGSCIPF